MKKIGIVIGSLSRGGAERVTVYLSEYFIKTDLIPYIITAGRGKNEYDVPKSVERICLTDGRKYSLINLITQLRKTILERKIDCLLIMDTPTCIYAMPATIGLNIKTIVSERNDPAHFSGKQYVKYISRLLMKKGDGFVFQTNDAMDYYKRSTHGKGIVIPNPLNTKRLPEKWTGQKEKKIVSVGRFDKQKNQDLLIKAFLPVVRKYPEYKLIIYGEGPLRGELESRIKELGLEENVSLPGNMIDVLERIKDAALFVLSSDFEGMPNALIEAMAIGLPCVSTDCPCGGPRYLIKNDINGKLVKVGDELEMSSAIMYLVENQKEADAMGNKAYKVRELLSIDHVGKQWKDYCTSLIAEGK